LKKNNEIKIERLTAGCYERGPLKYCYTLVENNGLAMWPII